MSRLPRLVVIAAALYLIVALLASYAVDVHDALGLRTRMLRMDMDHPALWYHLFSEGKATEILQWFILAGVTVAAATLAGRITVTKPRQASFWGLVAVGSALMLIEDAGNIRHTIAGYPADLAPAAYEELVAALGRMAIMGIIAAVLLYALVRYGSGPLRTRGVRGYLILGYAVYAVAAGASGTSWLTGYHDTVGAWVFEFIGRGELVVFEDRSLESFGAFLSDNVVEESMELFAASALLAAVLAALLQERRHSGIRSTNEAFHPLVADHRS